MKFLFTILLGSSLLWAGNTTALFDPSTLTTGPFPTNALTDPNPLQKTKLQVHLPSTPCSPTFSGVLCGDTTQLAELNLFDGFSVNPRTMVCFSDAINPNTLKTGISYVSVDGNAPTVGVNQIFYEPISHCAFVKPDQVLQQQTRYLLSVTDSVLDANGKKLVENKDFKNYLTKNSDTYCTPLSQAVSQTRKLVSGNLVVASLFTTMSATNWLEQARQFIDTASNTGVLAAGPVSSFSLASLKSMTWVPDKSGIGPQPIPLSALSNVDSVAFGLYLSPNFLNPDPTLGTPGSIITQPTDRAFNPPSGYAPVSFHVFLPPASKCPAGKGCPVVIYGHGLGDNQFGAPTFMASTLAAQGFATLAIEITGHGYGSGSVVQLTTNGSAPATYTVNTPGRGIQLSPPKPIGPTDGCILPGSLAVRDCARQSAVDLIALVQNLQVTKGFGYLDPSRIYYVGQSFGSTYGTLFHAVEPAVKSAVLNGAGGTSIDVARLAISGRPLGVGYLYGVLPALLNVPPDTPEDYFRNLPPDPVNNPYNFAFNDNYVFRDMSPVVNTNSTSRAPAVQAAFEVADWVGMLGEPLAYAPHFRTSPLSGVPQKNTIFQFGYGDLEVPNPTESALVRAAAGQDTTWFLRTDLAALLHPELLGVTMPGVPFPILPHRFLSNPTIFDVPAETSIALAAQQQAAVFFQGQSNPDPNAYLTGVFWGIPLFEPGQILYLLSPYLPTHEPERLNFLQIPR